MKMWGKPRTASPSPPTSRHSGMPPMSPLKDGSEKHGNITKGIYLSYRGHPQKQAPRVDDLHPDSSTKTGLQRGWLGLQAGKKKKKAKSRSTRGAVARTRLAVGRYISQRDMSFPAAMPSRIMVEEMSTMGAEMISILKLLARVSSRPWNPSGTLSLASRT